MANFMKWYDTNHKKLLIIPVAMFILAIVLIALHAGRTGDIMNKDVSLKGGISSTIYTDKIIDTDALQDTLIEQFEGAKVRRLAEFGSDKQIGIVVEIGETEEDILRTLLEQELGITLTDDNFSIEAVGSSLGSTFYQQMLKALIFAFIFMAIVVFFFFRSIVPALAVIFAAASDIIITLAIFNILGLTISTAGIAAMLLLIGYSIDTDVLLTTRVLKRKEGDVIDRVKSSMVTGITMTVTTLVAVFVGYLLSTSPVLKEIFLIIFIGLIIDVIVTYCMNAPVLMIHTRKKEHV